MHKGYKYLSIYKKEKKINLWIFNKTNLKIKKKLFKLNLPNKDLEIDNLELLGWMEGHQVDMEWAE